MKLVFDADGKVSADLVASAATPLTAMERGNLAHEIQEDIFIAENIERKTEDQAERGAATLSALVATLLGYCDNPMEAISAAFEAAAVIASANHYTVDSFATNARLIYEQAHSRPQECRTIMKDHTPEAALIRELRKNGGQR